MGRTELVGGQLSFVEEGKRPVEARKDNETIEPAAAATTRRSLIGGCRVLFPVYQKRI